ncbi:MAG: hypothetical protein ACXAC0_01295 [Candidatus Thorarchaeota archaeon]
MIKDKKFNGPTKCHNCESTRLFEHEYVGSGVEVRAFKIIKQHAFICVDCGYTMLFTREDHKDKILNEYEKQQ